MTENNNEGQVDENVPPGEETAPVSELAKLKGTAAPKGLNTKVEEAIRTRSGGRFFGRRVFADKVPIELLALVILLAGFVVFYFVYHSDTSSLKQNPDSVKPPPEILGE